MVTRVVVGIADLAVGRPGDFLVTHALGSCLGIVAHDPVARVGGMVHVMLPASSLNGDRARERPAMFVDTGVPLLFQACYRHGARKDRMVVKVAGGAGRVPAGSPDSFQVGRANLQALRLLFREHMIRISGEAVGGGASRDLMYDVSVGEVTVRSEGKTWAI